MVKLSELRNRSSSDAPPRFISDSRNRSSSDATPRPQMLSPAESVKSTTSTWTAGSPSSIGSLSPAPSLGSPGKKQSFTERHGAKGLTRKFSKKISFIEPPSPVAPLETQHEEPTSPDATFSVPPALKGIFTDAQVKTFKQLFEYYDKDKSGAIDKEELTLVLTEMGEQPTEERVQSLMNEVDFDGNGVIDFVEFLHVMNEKRGGDSSFGAIVHKVEKKLNPLLEGHQVTFMHKGSKVRGTLVKKQGPFWTVNLDEGQVVNSIPSSSLTRAVNTTVRISTSASSSVSPSMKPVTTPISEKSSPVSASKGKPSLSKLKINSLFKQVGVPDSPMSAISVLSAASDEKSMKSLPEAYNASESKGQGAKQGGRSESKAKKTASSADSKKPLQTTPVAESKFTRPSLNKLDSTEEKKLFGEHKTIETVKTVVRKSISISSNVSSPVVKEKKQPMGSFVSAERPKGAFESRDRPVESKKSSDPLDTGKSKSEDKEKKSEEGQGIFDAAQVSTFRELFRFYDKGGVIKKTELLTILSQMDIDLPPPILTAIIDKVDRGDGRISFDAFLSGLTRAKATKDYYTESEMDEEDSPIRAPRAPGQSGMFSDVSTLKGGSSDEDEEAKLQEHRRTWFKKDHMPPVVQVWQGSPRSPNSPENPNVTSKTSNTTTPTTHSNPILRSSGIVMGSSANLGTANIDNVLASLFPRAKIQHSSNGTVMITPNSTSVIETPQSRLEEIIGRFNVSDSYQEPLPRKQPPPYSPNESVSRPQRGASPVAPESEGEHRRQSALRGRNLIGGILTNQQSEKKAQARARNSQSNMSTMRPPSQASEMTQRTTSVASSSRNTPLTEDSSPPRPAPALTPYSGPHSGEVISSAALRLEWAKQQQQIMRDEAPLSTKDLAKFFADEATPKPKASKAPRRTPVVQRSTEMKIKKPSDPLKMSPSKLMSAGGALSSFSMCIYDAMGCVVSAVGRVVHVIEGSQAHRAGISCGDFVTGIGKYKVNSIETIQAAIESVRRDVEFKNINKEIDRRKERHSPNKSPTKLLDNGITPSSVESTLATKSPVTSPIVDVDDKVLVIVMTPGATKPHEVAQSQISESKGPSSYYAVL